MSGFEIIAGLAAAAGTAMQISGTLEQGKEEQRRYQYEQKQQEMQADEAMAASQRDAAQRYKEGRALLGQQRAAIAGSGGDLSDPSVINAMDSTADAITYSGDSEIYKGEQQARGYNDAAAVSGYNSSAAMRAARISATGQLFAGASSIFSRFGEAATKGRKSAAPVTLPYG